MVTPADRPEIRAWKPDLAGVREVFHARFANHAYPPHVHDVWTLFIVDQGAIRYELHRRRHGALPPNVSILPPHVVHDGGAATGQGFRERVLYLESSLLDERLIGPAVDRPDFPDLDLRAQVAALHDALISPDRELEAETRLASVIEQISASLGQPGPQGPLNATVDQAEHLRALLDAHLFERVTLASAAAAVGAGPTQLARSFTAAFGIAPHAYVIGRRLEIARDRILGGQALADVAAEVGFCDQAHFSRRFARHMGISPGRFRRAGRASPLPVEASAHTGDQLPA